ncbi:hypothetical protein [Romboutsia hominis]|uniref:hypothetical protein n=1 Tax=Romboutsia hominis TaxID=1507512 RepID=UPI001F066E3C|nr:hypothetical protein [Romboutsia hominis]MCH1959697.1 hypothetical protein [Romboutsia hominis]MCH1969880.1 hypothetical protein [Romboutsia hominis]
MYIDEKIIEQDINSIKVELLGDSDSKILREVLYSYYFNYNYNLIKTKYYINNITNYELKNSEDLKRVFGYSIDKIKGFDLLEEKYKELFIKLFCNYLNAYGLQNRERHLASKVKIEEERQRFKIYLLDNRNYVYLQFNGYYY